MTAEFADTDTIVLVKKDLLVTDWIAWVRGTITRRKLRQQMMAQYYETKETTQAEVEDEITE